MTPERFDNIEARTRAVEEAVIKFRYIAETVLIQYSDRIEALEKSVEEFRLMVYSTCDIKSKEIESSEKQAKKYAWDLHTQTLYILGGMFGLFIAALSYMNMSDGSIHEKINGVNNQVVVNTTNISSINNSLDKIDEKLDAILKIKE